VPNVREQALLFEGVELRVIVDRTMDVAVFAHQTVNGIGAPGPRLGKYLHAQNG